MNKLSIKAKVTLWYMSFILLIVVSLMIFIVAASDRLLQSSSQNKLKDAVENCLSEMEYDDGELEIDDDLDFFQDGIYLSVLDEDGQQLYGRVPSAYQSQTGFFTDKVQIIDINGEQWYIYDASAALGGYGTVWVRGITSVSESGTMTKMLLMLTLIGLPFIVVIAAFGGYNITRKALAPVTRITKTVEEINEGQDLSRRIRLGEGKDEIHVLANTFDQMFARLETSFEKEKQFTSDASHELRTPAAVIIAQCEYALENAETLAEAKESIRVILSQTQKASGLISQLLMLTRMDKGNQKLDMERINLSELAEMVAEELQITAAEKHIGIRQQIEKEIYVNADQTMLMRMMMNLLTNAVVYGKEGGHIGLILKREGNIVCGSVEDDGVGIAKENLEKIWDRFYQANPSRSAEHEGAGLGLAMVRWIVEAHGGSVFVKSTLGKGSVFGFKLPI